MRAVSKIAPYPFSALKICDECAGLPLTRSSQPVVPRRPITAVFGLLAPSSKPIATSAPCAAFTSAARDAARGRPPALFVAGSTTTMFMDLSAPVEFSALRAWIITTLPPFMSVMPGPFAAFGSRRSNFWKGLSGSNTVSRWPMSRMRGPGPDGPRRDAPRVRTKRRPPTRS